MKNRLKEVILDSIPENRDIVFIIPHGIKEPLLQDYISICVEFGLEYKFTNYKEYIRFIILNDINYKRNKKLQKIYDRIHS